MSHFTTIKTHIVDSKALIAALNDVGFNEVEVFDKAQPLIGFGGTSRQQDAEIIIRKKVVGSLFSDLGFKRGGDGTFDAIMDDYDAKKYSRKWFDQLTQRYAYHATKAKLEAQGFSLVAEEKGDRGQIHLVLRRMS